MRKKNCGGSDDDDDDDDGDEDDDHNEYTEYNGVEEPNTGENVSPADPAVAKLVIVRLGINFFILKS